MFAYLDSLVAMIQLPAPLDVSWPTVLADGWPHGATLQHLPETAAWGLPETPALRIAWACITAVLFCLVTDMHGMALGLMTGANRARHWRGFYVQSSPSLAVLYAPRWSRRCFLCILGKSVYRLLIQRGDRHGRVWGVITCLGAKHMIGEFELTPRKDEMNLPQLALHFHRIGKPVVVQFDGTV